MTVAASHVDGLPGCAELEFDVSEAENGTLGELTDVDCTPGAMLAADVDDAAVSLPVVTTAGFPDAGTLRVDDEIVTYTSKTDASFDGVTRGAAGTAASAHTAGATVAQAEAENAPLALNHNDEETIVVEGVGLGFPTEGVLQINDEWIVYGSATEVDSDADTTPDRTEFGDVVRGAFGTVASGHLAGDPAFLAVTAAAELAEGIDGSQTVVPVVSAAGLASPDGAVQIGEEVIMYAGIGTEVADCDPLPAPCLTGATRGALGTTAAAHGAGDTAFQASGVDTDAATATFTPDENWFGVAAALTGDITDATTIAPADVASSSLGAAFPETGTAVIGDEIVSYTGIGESAEDCDPVAPPCLTGLTRGVDGTAAAHSTEDAVYQAFFNYTAGHNPTSEAVFVGVIVTPVNDAPTTEDVAVELADSTEAADVTVTAQDLDGDSGGMIAGDCELGFTIAEEPEHGSLSTIANTDCTSNAPNTDGVPNEDSATVTYTPDEGYSGDDSFVVRACDDESCAMSTVLVTVGTATPTPTPEPTATPTPEPTPGPTPLPWAWGDIDCDGDMDAVDALAILLVLAALEPIEPGDEPCPTPGATFGPTSTPVPTSTPSPAPTPEPTATPTPEPS